MNRAAQRTKAEAFRALHAGPAPLVLGSVWDVASAVVFEQAGFEALGTSSAGVAYANGYPDDEGMPRERMLDAVRAIAARVRIPVSADMLTGYGDTPDVVAETCRLVLDAGAIGVNIEDTAAAGSAPLADVGLQCEKLRAVRAMADAYGVPLVVNARTDAYWLKVWDDKRRLEETIARANAYRAAGADCLFVPGALDPATIGRLVREIDGPVNILAMPGCPPVAELARLGVRRISEGSGPARAALETARKIARELRDRGTYTSYHDAAIAYPDANAMFGDRG